MKRRQPKIMRILRCLADARNSNSFFNPHNLPLNAAALAREFKLKVDDVVEICDALVDARVVERIDAGADYPYYRLPAKETVIEEQTMTNECAFCGSNLGRKL